MANYKNNRVAKEGDNVVGVDAKGNAVKGLLVMIHRVTNQVATNIAVVDSQKLIGDLKSADFLHADDVPKTETEAPAAA